MLLVGPKTWPRQDVNRIMFNRANGLARLVFGAVAKRLLSLLNWLPADQRADAVDILLSKPSVVDTPHGKILFLNHSRVSRWRARTIMTKEPDSIGWIDGMEP